MKSEMMSTENYNSTKCKMYVSVITDDNKSSNETSVQFTERQLNFKRDGDKYLINKYRDVRFRKYRKRILDILDYRVTKKKRLIKSSRIKDMKLKYENLVRFFNRLDLSVQRKLKLSKLRSIFNKSQSDYKERLIA